MQVGRDRLHEVAMGQGQSEVALELLKECAKTGGSCVIMLTPVTWGRSYYMHADSGFASVTVVNQAGDMHRETQHNPSCSTSELARRSDSWCAVVIPAHR